jgi:condensin-2 complex subunit H2
MDGGGGGGGGDGGSSSGRFPILQANRDPESNWELDVAKSLEEYLLKICSGEVTGEDGPHSVNFAEGTVVRRAGVSCGLLFGVSFQGVVALRYLLGFVELELGRWKF